MPSRDISFCLTVKCPQQRECYRHVRPEDTKEWQSFTYFAPDADGWCDGFMRVVKHKKARKGE
jgi:hypothetical protein